MAAKDRLSVLLAMMEQLLGGGGPEWLTILDRTGKVVARSQKFLPNVFRDGLAWTPDGREWKHSSNGSAQVD